MNTQAPIFVAGHRGLVGSALCRALTKAGCTALLTRTRQELDLCRQDAVHDFFATTRPQYVFVSAAKVGGIHANASLPAQFLYENLCIQNNIIHSAWACGVKKLLFLGSSCIYPKHCPQPIVEDALLSGSLEPTNRPYALAKIAGIELCATYRAQYGFDAISLMPCNLYGPGDTYHPEYSHVIPALIRKFHEAQRDAKDAVLIWGSGTPRREFLHVDDLAQACLFLMNNYSEASPINVGTGTDMRIMELAHLVASVIGFQGQILTDTSRPDGTMEKTLDVSKIHALGWKATRDLKAGLRQCYEDALIRGVI